MPVHRVVVSAVVGPQNDLVSFELDLSVHHLGVKLHERRIHQPTLEVIEPALLDRDIEHLGVRQLLTDASVLGECLDDRTINGHGDLLSLAGIR